MARLIKNRILIIILSCLAGLYCSHSVNEKEPENNFQEHALQLNPGQKLIGSFYSAVGTDIDYIFVKVEAPAMIKGHLSSVKGIDSEILFFHPGERLPFKVANDNKSSLDERFGPYFIESPGLIIAIRSTQPVNDQKYVHLKYEFLYDLYSPTMPMEIEANDTIEQANALIGNPIRGYYNNALSNHDIEKDFFYVDLPETKKYRISATLSGVTGIDAVLRLYSTEGERLLTVDNSAAGGDENIFSYGVYGPTRIYLSVNSKDYKISESENYELKVTADLYEDKYELEPNDSIIEATPIKARKILGDFSNHQDVDYFKFFNDTLEPMNLSAEVVPSSNYNIALELYQGAGLSPVMFDDGGDGLSEGFSALYIKPLETVYLKLARKSQSGSAAYILNTLITPISENQEREPNNSRISANSIFPEKAIAGYFNPANDRDYYRIKINNQNIYSIKLESSVQCLMNISVLDSKGIKTEGKMAVKPGENILLSTILEPDGYLLANCQNIGQPTYKEPYQIQITKNVQ